MNAAKHFDPVLGIDIHIIQPPGPVPPLPIPHPFIGMLIDPMEYAPVIGGTVKVNGMMRGVAGTGGKCLPPHIPIGGMFVKPPGNECTVFMGSQTVVFDGDPASRLGMMVLSCHCVGMPAPPRIKPHSKPTSLELPTSVVLPIPAGPPVLIGGPPTITLMGALKMFGPFLRWIQKGSKFAGKFAAISTKLRGVASRVLGPRLGGLANRAICFLTGHPVDVASGQLLTEAVDIELPGPLPFKLERVWYSRSDHRGPLGHGWHHSYDLALTEFPEGVLVRLADGRLAAFDTPERGQPEFNRLEKLFLHRVDDGFDLEDLDGRVYHFGSAGAQGTEWPLEHYRDPNGNRIELVRKGGRLREFIDSGGRHLAVISDAEGRITEIHGPDPAAPGKTFALVSYRYSAEGDLVEARDALGNPFKYQYDRHLLIKETDRGGLSFYFMYDQPGSEARCVKTWGDGNIFLRELTYDVARQRTVAINSLGHATVYEWNDLGVVTKEIDPLGGETVTEWDAHGNVLSDTNPCGETTMYEYDILGRRVSTTNPLGQKAASLYDVAGNVVEVVDEAGSAWQYAYDARRNLVAATDPCGACWTYEPNSRGETGVITDALGHRIRLVWDSHGNLMRWIARDGSETRMEYDALGRLVHHVDAEGGKTLLAYDRNGRPSQHVDEAGRIKRFRHDAVGELSEIEANRARHRFTNGASGQVASVQSAGGQSTRYEYDTEGDVVAVRDHAQRAWRFDLDANGSSVGERTVEGQRLSYKCDAVGRLMSVTNTIGERTDYRRDKAGRIIARVYHDGTEETFKYDSRGLLIEARNTSAEVKIEYDAVGRVIRETINGRSVESRYDQNGNRVARVSLFGRTMLSEYDAEERPIRFEMGPESAMSITYDAIGRETVRALSNGVVNKRAYTPISGLASSSVERAERTLLAFDYQYDNDGRPSEFRDATFGTTRYHHDADGTLIASIYSDGTEVKYNVRSIASQRGSEKPAVEAEFWNGPAPASSEWKVRYDDNGHLIEKSNSKERFIFEYDPAGRLASVTNGTRQLARFEYDPLGRRVRKVSAEGVLEFVWDEDDMIGEMLDGAPHCEYIYVPGSFEPLACVSPTGVAFLECNPVGLPLAAINEQGLVVWHAQFRSFGELRNQLGEGVSIPIRFPGQYADPETGLCYNRHRYYDPSLCAFISPDPLGLAGGIQPYEYAPSPLTWIDPYGLKKTCWVDGRGRKQVVITFPTKKRARDARPRPRPQKPKAEGGQRTTRQTKRNRGEGARGEKHRRGGTHVHDDRHTNPNSPNVHYEFPE